MTSATVITPFRYQPGRYSVLSKMSGLYHNGIVKNQCCYKLSS